MMQQQRRQQATDVPLSLSISEALSRTLIETPDTIRATIPWAETPSLYRLSTPFCVIEIQLQRMACGVERLRSVCTCAPVRL